MRIFEPTLKQNKSSQTKKKLWFISYKNIRLKVLPQILLLFVFVFAKSKYEKDGSWSALKRRLVIWSHSDWKQAKLLLQKKTKKID